MKGKSKALKNQISPFSIILCTVLILYTLIMFSMIGWGLMKSFQSTADYEEQFYSRSAFPKEWTFENYELAFSSFRVQIAALKEGQAPRMVYFPEMLFNSVLYSVGGALVNCGTALIVAYLTSKYRNKFNGVIEGVYYFAMLVPIVGSMPSTLQVTKALGTHNTWVGIFLMQMNFLGADYLIFKAMFKTLDNGYAEAAKIDGAGHFTIMFKIIFPLVKTTFMILFVTSFINYWNNYQTPMVYLGRHPTASYGLFKFSQGGTAIPGRMDYIIYKLAGYMILLIPTFALFMVMKDKMIGNLTIGGLKG